MELLQGMHANGQSGAQSRICVGKGYSQEFEVMVRVNKGCLLDRAVSSALEFPVKVSLCR